MIHKQGRYVPRRLDVGVAHFCALGELISRWLWRRMAIGGAGSATALINKQAGTPGQMHDFWLMLCAGKSLCCAYRLFRSAPTQTIFHAAKAIKTTTKLKLILLYSWAVKSRSCGHRPNTNPLSNLPNPRRARPFLPFGSSSPVARSSSHQRTRKHLHAGHSPMRRLRPSDHRCHLHARPSREFPPCLLAEGGAASSSLQGALNR